MSCEEDKLEFYEMYNNKKYVYYSFLYPLKPEKTKTKTSPTPTPKASYGEYTFKGVIENHKLHKKNNNNLRSINLIKYVNLINLNWNIFIKNHIEMFLDDETLFETVAGYEEEFEFEK
ncbi:hypothetical protein H8356DRAFT_1071936 [Neocallimastix lanati (nom. inval.)]|nr:hypothetical protein H8356DRAFT_1071936 [Neocallimastix sp. JGI-2020a]